MKKRQTNAERQLANEQKQEALRKLSEEFRKILARGPDPNYPVIKLSIEEQIALGIPLDTGWVTTMRPPFSRRRTPKPKPKSNAGAMNAWSITAAFLAATLTACTSPEPPKDAIVRKAEEVSAIHVHSLPPGCFVELNNEFMGVTPLTIRVPSYRGDWSGGFGKYHILRASIPRGRGYDQKLWRTGDPVPERVVLRVPGAEHWYHANSPKRPEKPAVQVR